MNLPEKNSLQRWIDEQERKKEMSFSYYTNQEPATEQQIKEVIAGMAANYDKKTIDFWKKLKEVLIEDKWSYDRLKYVEGKMIRFVKYQTWTIADLMELDRAIDRMTSAEAENLPEGHKPLAYANFGDRWWICYKEDAERLGLEHKTWVTNKDMKYKVEDYD